MRDPNAFARDPIDRAGELRSRAEDIEALGRGTMARVHLVWRDRSFALTGATTRAAWVAMDEASALWSMAGRPGRPELVFLGRDTGAAHFALDVSAIDEPNHNPLLAGRGEFLDLRQLSMALPERDAHVLAYARAMATWHRRHRFCGACGGPTEIREAGHLRVCTAEGCGRQTFPRTDPAVIMLVHDGANRCLLGRQAAWPPGIYSALAGFVEPGESLEQAVKREVDEESGVVVHKAIYHSSQPWPFPSSVMLGFFAEAEFTEPVVRDGELEDARWFTRAELREKVELREIRLPYPISIARRLVDDWLAENT